jgi:2-polyprenyl-3-methyl-5-hydroxy-6-metoxy-1,4-benzoquinol methylase
VGCGSGLFSLAARQMGARVLSFDYDPQSVECARELRKRFFPDDPDWDIRQGSALDADFLGGLGTFDLVYSWGVLHHTGDMWRALAQMPRLLTERGLLVVSLYNECGLRSRFWRGVKRFYCRSPKPVRWALLLGAVGAGESLAAFLRLTRGQNLVAVQALARVPPPPGA